MKNKYSILIMSDLTIETLNISMMTIPYLYFLFPNYKTLLNLEKLVFKPQPDNCFFKPDVIRLVAIYKRWVSLVGCNGLGLKNVILELIAELIIWYGSSYIWPISYGGDWNWIIDHDLFYSRELNINTDLD